MYFCNLQGAVIQSQTEDSNLGTLVVVVHFNPIRYINTTLSTHYAMMPNPKEKAEKPKLILCPTSSIFRPAVGCCEHQTLVELVIFREKMLKKFKKRNKFAAKFKKNVFF